MRDTAVGEETRTVIQSVTKMIKLWLLRWETTLLRTFFSSLAEISISCVGRDAIGVHMDARFM